MLYKKPETSQDALFTLLAVLNALVNAWQLTRCKKCDNIILSMGIYLQRYYSTAPNQNEENRWTR
jgi:hypothetical protein